MNSRVLTPALIKRVVSDFKLDLRSVHGPAHWMRVRRNGLFLANHTGANKRVIELFALFHDSCRLNDWTDSDHGPRAADYAASLFYDEHLLPCSEEELQMLVVACEGHTHGGVHDDPTIGSCWDSDRLDLPRVGIAVDPTYLCTEYGKQADVIQASTARAFAWVAKIG